jgi:hypothetical protein
MGVLGSLFTPQTELLRAQMRGIDTNLTDLERLGGSAVQESREDLRRRRRDVMNMMGRMGGTSTDMDNLLTGIETQQQAQENSVSQEVMLQQGQAERMKQQIAQQIGPMQTQEIIGSVKDVVGTAAQVAAPFLGPAGIPVAMAGAALAGNDPGQAATGLEGFQDWRERMKYGAPAVADAGTASGIYAEQPADRKGMLERYVASLGR